MEDTLKAIWQASACRPGRTSRGSMRAPRQTDQEASCANIPGVLPQPAHPARIHTPAQALHPPAAERALVPLHFSALPVPVLTGHFTCAGVQGQADLPDAFRGRASQWTAPIAHGHGKSIRSPQVDLKNRNTPASAEWRALPAAPAPGLEPTKPWTWGQQLPARSRILRRAAAPGHRGESRPRGEGQAGL